MKYKVSSKKYVKKFFIRINLLIELIKNNFYMLWQRICPIVYGKV